MNKSTIETKLTVIFSIIAFISLIISLMIKGFSVDNISDSIFNASALIVTIAVFLVARKSILKKQSFIEKFESRLSDWASKNKYLVWDNTANERGLEGKRAYFMVVKPDNHVFAKKLAKEQKCGRFLELPSRKDMDEKKLDRIRFCLNESTFLNSKQDLSLESIAQQFTSRIREEFGQMNITAQNTGANIDVSLENIEKTNTNAEKLIEMVDFVKEMVLALC